MTASVNKVILIGNLGKDPEVKTTQDNQKIVTLSLATNETWNDKGTNTKKQRVEWHRVVIFNDVLANLATTYLKKGSKVYVDGQLHSHKWTDKNGVEHNTTEIAISKYRGELVLLDAVNTRVGGSDFSAQQTLPYNSPNVGAEINDEIPF